MRPIPQKIRTKFKTEKCLTCNNIGNERHHALIYQGKQINEQFAIISLCSYCHRGNNGAIWQAVKEKSELKAIEDGLEELIKKYPKFDWKQRMVFLRKKYENRNTD